MTSAIDPVSTGSAAPGSAEESPKEEGEDHQGMEEGLLDNIDEDNSGGDDDRSSTIPSVGHHVDHKIYISALVFAIAQLCTFFIPAWLSKHSEYCSGAEFFCPAAVDALLILFTTALITSGLACFWTVKAWKTSIPKWTRIIGILPIVTFTLILVTSFIYSNTHNSSHPSCVPGEDGCPQTKPPKDCSFESRMS